MFITVNNIDLYYEVKGQGRPVIMVHGNSEDHTIFRYSAPKLAKNHQVYTVDSRCHGKSGKTDDLSYDLMASDMIAFIKELNIEKPVFYGFSDGGIIGLLIAMKEPDILGQLIISGANLYPEGLNEKTLGKIKKTAAKGNRLFRLMAQEPHIDPEELRAITVPVVVLAGEHDVVLREHTELIAGNIPDSTLEIIPGEGHSSYISYRSKLYPIIKKYL